MWLGGMVLWTVLFWMGVVLVAMWGVRLLLPHAPEWRSRWGGGTLLVVTALVVMSMFAGWGMSSPWTAPYPHLAPGGGTFWMSHMGWRWHPDPSTELVAPSAAGAPTVRVNLVEFAFRPSEIRIKGWQPVNLELINKGALLHAVAIPALGVHVTLQPGENKIVRLDWLKAGTYEFYCTLPGHREAGMTGTLVVGPSNVKAPL